MCTLLKLSLILIYFSNLVTILVYAQESGSTNFVNKSSKLSGYAEAEWFIDNIPFIEVPDAEIEEIYYYRFSSLKRHLRYTVPGAGYIITEFVHKIGYSNKFDTINAAAGHHIDEARWLRNTRYLKDYINMWAREGAGNQQYSEWIAHSSYNAFLLNGDVEFIKSQEEGLVNNFRGWDDRYEGALDLYFLTPHDDAQEHSCSSEQTGDGYHGGLGYRPSFNSEMYANAIAISKIAQLNNHSSIVEEFQERAKAIRNGINNHLWDKDRKFYYHMFRENNTENELLDSREEIGFFPWRFGVPEKDESEFNLAWEQLFDPQGFNTEFGPTTCEVRSPWFVGNRTDFCWWSGDHWPYSTGFTLKAFAAQIKEYAITQFANKETFLTILKKYAGIHYRNGLPYVAEAHSPIYKDLWLCDGFNHSEHYAHSTYTDNILSDLIGIEPQSHDVFEVNPLVSSTWTYFIAENIPYHGNNITVLYDKDGTKYQTGRSGMQIFLNGELVAFQSEIGKMRIEIPPPPITQNGGENNKIENYAANADGFGYPMVDASFTSEAASEWQVIDGRIFYDYIPSNRWTNYGSPNSIDWFLVDFGPGRFKNINQVKLYIYSDFVTGKGDVDCPSKVVVEYLNDRLGMYFEAPNQNSFPTLCVPNAAFTITFDTVLTQKIRILFTRNFEKNTYVGFTELEIWAPWPQILNSNKTNTYEAEDGYLGEFEILKSESASSLSYVKQLNVEGAFLEITGVWVDKQGNYSIQLLYANGGDVNAKMNLIVNNIHSQIVEFPVTSNTWGTFKPDSFVTIDVQLSRGNNVFIFKKQDNISLEIDYLTLIV